ncbi:wax ester/triacylglycerol synthase family O-acyltransferase [Myxococcota bacterium]|nr:wax ester/triacylglycerol synthase family O-acyltransferase [Myxococcota bacterium]
MWFERLSSLDATFLWFEDRTAHMHVGAVAVFEGKPPRYQDLCALIESRLDRVPRYRQRLMMVPFQAGRPVWVDESHFELEYHVRHTALPAPGGLEQLQKLAGRLFAQRLDRDKPLWELWFIEGLGENRFAILSKTHHCMIDGVSGVDLATVLLDFEPTAGPPPTRAPWMPRPAPTKTELLRAAMIDQVKNPVEFAKNAARAAGEERKMLMELAAGIKPLLGMAQMGSAPVTSVNHALGPHRRFEVLSLDLAEVKRIKSALGGTVNDVILATVAGALRTLFVSRGEYPAADLRVMVPVSVRGDNRGTFGNQVTAMFCTLPITEPDPTRRLERIRLEMKNLKDSHQAVGAIALTRLGEFAPPTLVAQAARLEMTTRFFNLVVTNVPGPQFPLYLLEARLEHCYPMVPLSAHQNVGVALLSYDGGIDVGLLGDADNMRDLSVLTQAMRDALAELSAIAGERLPAPAAEPLSSGTGSPERVDAAPLGGA